LTQIGAQRSGARSPCKTGGSSEFLILLTLSALNRDAPDPRLPARQSRRDRYRDGRRHARRRGRRRRARRGACGRRRRRARTGRHRWLGRRRRCRRRDGAVEVRCRRV